MWDPTNQARQPNGKQRLNPGGIFYTPVTGIWQTVWLETVNVTHAQSLKVVPNIDDKTVNVTVNAASNAEAVISVLQDGRVIAEKSARANTPAALALMNPRLWSPEDPFLYDELLNDLLRWFQSVSAPLPTK